MSNAWSFETRQIHAGQEPDSATGARSLPIYQTTSFVFPSAESAANRFALAELAPIYTRIGNPTQDAVEQRVASLEGGLGALLLSSGQAAETFAILNIAEAGDHVVASPSLYGGTYNLLAHTLKKFGISVTFVEDPDNLQQWRDAVQPNTKLFFGEVVSNPRQDVLDIEGVADVAHRAGVPLIVDNTLSTPYLIRPIEWGADIVVHSATLTALATCRSTRRLSVSMPWAMRKALNGDTAEPRSRSSWTRALRMKDRFAPSAPSAPRSRA